MVGSLLTWGIGHIHSSTLKEYQIIFLFFGVCRPRSAVKVER